MPRHRSTLMHDHASDTVAKIQALKNIDVRIPMDDVGAGHSSLPCLKQLRSID